MSGNGNSSASGIFGAFGRVSGRSALDEEQRRLDLYYVEDWSLYGDLIWRAIEC
jgi:lipopolysaccharide/colanic/teichoic acid biosynthesis glycosyltransferase